MSLQEILLQKLKNQNPQGYEAFMQIYRSGKSPEEAIAEMRAEGKINDSQIAMARRQAALLGAQSPSPKKREAEEPKAPSRLKGLF